MAPAAMPATTSWSQMEVAKPMTMSAGTHVSAAREGGLADPAGGQAALLDPAGVHRLDPFLAPHHLAAGGVVGRAGREGHQPRRLRGGAVGRRARPGVTDGA